MAGAAAVPAGNEDVADSVVVFVAVIVVVVVVVVVVVDYSHSVIDACF